MATCFCTSVCSRPNGWQFAFAPSARVMPWGTCVALDLSLFPLLPLLFQSSSLSCLTFLPLPSSLSSLVLPPSPNITRLLTFLGVVAPRTELLSDALHLMTMPTKRPQAVKVGHLHQSNLENQHKMLGVQKKRQRELSRRSNTSPVVRLGLCSCSREISES